MPEKNESIDNLNDFNKNMKSIEEKTGKILLSDDDLLMLACREIAKTYTRDEKDYK
jgi:hypothetical protein